MAEPADLEIGLHRRDADSYIVELRFSQPDSDTEDRLTQDKPIVVQFDMAQLRELQADHQAYGQALADSLFAEEAMRQAFTQARALAGEAPLRLRLSVGPSAPELHALRWETLCDPQDGAPLCIGAQIHFSRYLSSGDWRPIRLRPHSDLRALVVIANPSDLAAYQLAPIDVAGELDRAKQGLGTIPSTPLASDGKATLGTMAARLREGYDILYLVAHGKFIRGEAQIWMEDEHGAVDRVSGADFITELKSLEERPRLVVLASCQSAGSGEEAHSADEGVLATLGARLAAAGIPAVLAMQGNVTMKTVAMFMPLFFTELQSHGYIDRAISVARGAIRGRHDFWMPVLFMRLKSGRIWYVPGFADERGRADEKWEPLINSIRDGECTPILGPDLSERLLGSRRDLSSQLAEDFHFPLAPHDREGLPQVAQFLAVNKSVRYLISTVTKYLCASVRRRQRNDLPPAVQDIDLEKASSKDLLMFLDTWLSQAWNTAQARDPAEPHRVLASLPFPIYLTADPSDLLVQALRAAGKQPQVMCAPWNDDTRKAASPYTDNPEYDPDEQHPLVYQLFGSYRETKSLVLTEDNHFDYLIGITNNKDTIPQRVRSMLADSALLFLGFRPDDWAFRVFFRGLMNQAGGGRRSNYASIAVQVAPEEGRILLPKLAQRYLEDYFTKGADISIYWGSAEDFVRGLHQRW